MLVSPHDCSQIKPLRLLLTVSLPSAAFIALAEATTSRFHKLSRRVDFQVAYFADVS